MGDPDPDLWPRTLQRLASHEALSTDDAADVMRAIMSGDVTPAQVGGFLMALRTKGETVDELDGLARTALEFANPVSPPAPVLCSCGWLSARCTRAGCTAAP
jgi:anthranilate phosphoribosyltransferase